MNDSPLCFVLMPFGTKKDPTGGADINFDAVYEEAIRPAVESAGMEAVRADEERTGGIIHKAMFERLILCDFAVADLTTWNANVFYELGFRHAVRPYTTLAIYDTRQKPPFDLNSLRCLPYEVAEAGKLKDTLAKRLIELRDMAREDTVPDSPVFQLLTGYGAPDIARLKTDTFRERVRYATNVKNALADAREDGDAEEVSKIEVSLGKLDGIEAGVLVDVFLSYRALEQWDRMVKFYERLPVTLQRTSLVQEQLGFALNRLRQHKKSLRVLAAVAQDGGPSSETNGLIGRVYKDLWTEANQVGDNCAQGYLDQAIDAYCRGFEADWRDAYAGINAVTLLDIRGDEASLQRKSEMLPVVRFAVKQRLKASSKPDYWDYATLLELAVLESDAAEAKKQQGIALAAVRETWEPASTANNLKLIREARQARGLAEPWLDDVIAALEKRAKKT